MDDNLPRHLTLEGPAVIYCVDNLWRITIHDTIDDAACAARDLMSLNIANPAYIAILPRISMLICNPYHPIQPEGP